jgi:hypothetical protein
MGRQRVERLQFLQATLMFSNETTFLLVKDLAPALSSSCQVPTAYLPEKIDTDQVI